MRQAAAPAELASNGVDLIMLLESATTRACPRRTVIRTSKSANLAAGHYCGLPAWGRQRSSFRTERLISLMSMLRNS